MLKETLPAGRIGGKKDVKFKSQELLSNLTHSPEELEQLHDEVDKKICQKVFEKIKDCKGDNSTICGELKDALIKDSDIKPVYVDYRNGRVDVYFDSNVRSKDYLSGNKIGGIIITIMLKPTEPCGGVFEPYIGGPEELDYAWNGKRGDRPVRIRHYDNKSHYNSHNKSKELLEEKTKLYESL